MTLETSQASGARGASPGSPRARRRRRSPWLLVHFGVFALCVAYLVLSAVAVAAFGPQAVHDALGERFYNSMVAGGGMFQVALVLVALGLIDVLVLAVLALRWLSRSRRGAVVTGVIVLAVAYAAVAVILRVRARPDPVRDQLLALIFPMDIEYAPGYSLAAFTAIEPGMSRTEVLERLGPPLLKSRMGPSAHAACYAWSPTDGNYWLREIIFGPDERVRRVVVGLWVD